MLSFIQKKSLLVNVTTLLLSSTMLVSCKPDPNLALTQRLNFIVDTNTNLAPIGYRLTGMSGVSASAIYPAGVDSAGHVTYTHWNRAAGVSHSEQGKTPADIKVTTDMKFAIGSQSKLYTAVILLKLAEAGYMSPKGTTIDQSLENRVDSALDSTLNEWLPKLQDRFPELAGKRFDDRQDVCKAEKEPADLPRSDAVINFVCGDITLRQLLNERSGLADHISTGNTAYNQALTALYPPFHKNHDLPIPPPLSLVLNHIPPNKFAPNAGFNYANTGYLILGLIIEAAVNADHQTPDLSFSDVFNQIIQQSTAGSLGILGMGLENVYTKFNDIPGNTTDDKHVVHGWSTIWNDDLLCLNSSPQGRIACMHYADGAVTGYSDEPAANLFNLKEHRYQDNLAVTAAGEQVFNLNAWDAIAGPAGSNYAMSSDNAQFVHIVLKGEFLQSSTLLSAEEFIASDAAQSYGLGIRKRTHASLGTLYYHGGQTPFHSSMYVYNPDLDVTIALAFNSLMGPSAYEFKDLGTVIAEELLQEIKRELKK